MRLISPVWPVLGVALAGCSLLYNADNLPSAKLDAGPEPPPIDAAPPPDMPTDVEAASLVLEAAAPLRLFEGQGTGGSRPAVLAITGGNIGPDATIELIPVDGAAPVPMIEIDNAHAVRSPSGTAIAVPVTLPIDPSAGSDGAADVLMTVQVSQMSPAGVIHRMVPETMIKLTVLPELTAPVTTAAQLAALYSQVDVAAGLTFAPGSPRVVIRAVGSIVLGPVKANAAGATAGAGGAAGGPDGQNGAGPSGGAHGGLLGGGLLVAGAGGGFGAAGGNGSGALGTTLGGGVSGDAFLVVAANNGSSGGGSGLGSSGGGGGGAIEITAGGTLMIGQVTALGAPAPDNGGGGSGGAIVLRSGSTALIGALSVAGGNTANAASGDGGGGRVRYDVAGIATAPAITAGSARRGAAFVPATADINPSITTAAHQPFQLVSEASATTFNVYVANAAGVITESSTANFGSPTASVTPTTSLTAGYNRVCVTPPNGNLSLIESVNCIDVAYVP